MKKTTKIWGILIKIISIVVSLSIIFTFASCGGKNEDTKENDKEYSNKKDKDKNEKENEETPDNQDKGTLTIGISGPLTGSAKKYGNSVVNGARMAIDEINNSGGINGMELELICYDDEADSGDKAVIAYHNLVDDGMQISLGSVTSGSAKKFCELATEDNIFTLLPTASGEGLTNGKNVFRYCDVDSLQGKTAANYISDNNIAKRVAILYNSTDNYSRNLRDMFVSSAQANGIEIVGEQIFTNDTSSDFSAQLQAIKLSGAELLFIPVYYNEAALIISQAKQIGLNIKFFGCDGLDGILSMPYFETSLFEGVMILGVFTENLNSKTKDFSDKYKQKYGADTLTIFAAQAYDSIYVLKEAIEKAEIKSSMSPSEMCELLSSAICDIEYDGLVAENINWTEDGETTREAYVVKIKNGKYVPAK